MQILRLMVQPLIAPESQHSQTRHSSKAFCRSFARVGFLVNRADIWRICFGNLLIAVISFPNQGLWYVNTNVAEKQLECSDMIRHRLFSPPRAKMCKVANALHEVWTWRIRSFLSKHGLWQIEQPRRKCGHSYRRAMAMGRSKLRWIRKCRHVGLLRKLCTVSWAPGPRSIEVQKMMISLCSPGWIESDLVEIDGTQKNLEDQTVSCFSFDFSFPSVSPTVVFPLPLVMIREAPPETSNSGETALLFRALSKMSNHWAA